MISRRKPIRDPKHLAFLKNLPCIKCDMSPCDPHHLRISTDGATGLKPSDSFALPLCRKHHTELHTKGERTFFKGNISSAKHLTVALYCANGNTERALQAIREYRGN